MLSILYAIHAGITLFFFIIGCYGFSFSRSVSEKTVALALTLLSSVFMMAAPFLMDGVTDAEAVCLMIFWFAIFLISAISLFTVSFKQFDIRGVRP